MDYTFEPVTSTPQSAAAPRRSRLWTCLMLIGLVLVVAVSAGLGAGGGYLLARRELAGLVQSGPAPIPQIISVKQDSAVIEAVRKVKPAVVTVVNTLSPQAVAPQGFVPFGLGPMLRQQEAKASGSGVIVDNQGHIITNFHVVDKAARLEVIFADGTKASTPAILVGSDPYNDLAVLRIGAPVPAFAEMGDSTALQEGETVVAIGSPLGEFRGSVTVGVVSAVNRTLDVNQNLSLEGLIQTDAAINTGNSGGPLINLAGQIIGINTAIVRTDPTSGRMSVGANEVAEGLGFSIPTSIVRDVANQIIATGKVEYPYLGVRYQEITPAIAAAYAMPIPHGLFVQDVERGSPAALAGIQRGDIVADIDGVPLNEDHPLVNVLMKRKIGEEVMVTIYRGTQKMSLKVKLTGR